MYTLEVHKRDARRKSGERLVLKKDYDTTNRTMLEQTVRETWPESKGYRTELHETFVSRTNLMTGQPVQERYDLPWSCSVASESYWSS
jgi:hypothetical protein